MPIDAWQQDITETCPCGAEYHQSWYARRPGAELPQALVEWREQHEACRRTRQRRELLDSYAPTVGGGFEITQAAPVPDEVLRSHGKPSPADQRAEELITSIVRHVHERLTLYGRRPTLLEYLRWLDPEGITGDLYVDRYKRDGPVGAEHYTDYDRSALDSVLALGGSEKVWRLIDVLERDGVKSPDDQPEGET